MLIFKSESGKRNGILSLSLYLWKNRCFVLSAFIHRAPFKNIFDFFVSYFKQVVYVTMQEKKACVVFIERHSQTFLISLLAI